MISLLLEAYFFVICEGAVFWKGGRGNPHFDVAAFPGVIRSWWGSFPLVTFIHFTDSAGDAVRLASSWERCAWMAGMEKGERNALWSTL